MDSFVGFPPESGAGADSLLAFADDDPDGGTHPPRWSSFIGIIISIVGNIVISFALNIQKYAHIRLARAKSLRLQERKKYKRRRRRRRKLLAANKGVANGRNGASTETDGLLHPPESNGSPNGLENGDEEDLEGSWISTDTYDSPEGEDGRGRALMEDEEDRYLLESPERSPSKNGGVGGAPPYLRSKWWWTGIILMTIGECGNFLAYGFAPASIVSPLGVVALISNCLIAPLMLKEPFRRRDLLGVVIAIFGVAVVVSSSQPKEEKLTPGQIWWEISQTPFEVYFTITCTLIVVLLYLSGKHGSRFILIDLGLVGLFGGYTALATKGVSSLLSSSLYKIVTYPVFYLLVIILVSTAVLQIKYLSRSLQRFDSTQVIPTQFVLFNIFTVTGSAILYRDFEKADAARFIRFLIGCFLNFAGVYLISSKRERNYESDYDSTISETEDEHHFDPDNPIMRVSSIDNTPYSDHPRTSLQPGAPSTRRDSSIRSTNSFRRTQIPAQLHSPPNEASPLLPPAKNPLDDLHTPLTPTVSRSPSRRRPAPISTTPVATPPSASTNPNRSSLSLLTPGPLFVGYQLQAVVADTLKRGVDHILEEDLISPHQIATATNQSGSLRDKKVRKVKSVGASLGGWLRGESQTILPTSSTSKNRRKRAGTMDSTSDLNTRQSIRSRLSRSGSGASASVSGPSSSSNNGVNRYSQYSDDSVMADPARRRTIAFGEGAADEERRSGIRRPSPGVVETVLEGGDAPLPDPRTTSRGDER
ncbi:hypothetical protein AOL_s00079g319 [Orbilia oligospora ATCC 24927]|uniref:Uncharacterized protein n=2 Tax=Orbilia oligospora TaxID=2813651 RepID=G1XDD4_ARTOA|nr:hypothetical protein AOL_s00079g319 [Orbilia oligospora ATCC 24927]EGX48680.1 hypothetical protein AOL_s00079g319 [Orbilia oligospora ATCC 24927]KAF3275711.1 hypothetical protein TWF970_006615 [Orbilia oligospora]